MEFGRVPEKDLDTLDFSLPKDPTANKLVLKKTNKKPLVYLGCAKWGRKEWIGKIYPKGTRDAQFLDQYVRHYNAIELNATHYKIYKPEEIAKWAAKASGRNFKFCPKITNSISGRGSANAIEEVLQKVNLYERRNSRFSSYSLGMKQRLAIAAALLGEPKVLVLDEPTNGLDPVGIAEIRELMIALNKQGHTIIMASHLLDEVEKVCTHVAILKRGELITTGHVNDVLVDDDIVEIGADNIDALAAAVYSYRQDIKVTRDENKIQLILPKGTAKLDEINSYCFSKDIVLNHLLFKKKRLEAKFFELTNN